VSKVTTAGPRGSSGVVCIKKYLLTVVVHRQEVCKEDLITIWLVVVVPAFTITRRGTATVGTVDSEWAHFDAFYVTVVDHVGDDVGVQLAVVASVEVVLDWHFEFYVDEGRD
jgi:hypothetical protein